MNSYEEFLKKDKPKDYFIKVHDELSRLNQELNLFNKISDPSKLNNFLISVKDNLCVKDIETTASSKILEGYIPPFDATVISKIKEKNMFSLLGKTNMDEFGFGSFGVNSEKQAKNPFNKEYVSGGSSSGSAIATSILKYHISIAESTGGSISTPSAFCGVVGFTPTYGSISRYGLIDYANSLDKIGIMARKAEDVKFMYDIIKGPDKYDTTCINKNCTNQNNKIIILIDELIKGLNPEIEKSFLNLVNKFEKLGYTVKHKSIPFIDKSIASYYIIAMAEASTNLAKYTGFKYGFKNENISQKYNEFFTDSRSNFGKEAKRRIVLGTFVRSASVKDLYYSKALKIRSLLIQELNKVLDEGFILSPVMPIKTPKFSELNSFSPLEIYKTDILTIPPNLCGLPHISFPYDYLEGMPLGAQLITKHWNDYAIIDVVSQWESIFNYKFKYNLGLL
ncbi:MAG: amidase family protein [Candidatus Micrarchaeaceae archaeon]